MTNIYKYMILMGMMLLLFFTINTYAQSTDDEGSENEGTEETTEDEGTEETTEDEGTEETADETAEEAGEEGVDEFEEGDEDSSVSKKVTKKDDDLPTKGTIEDYFYKTYRHKMLFKVGIGWFHPNDKDVMYQYGNTISFNLEYNDIFMKYGNIYVKYMHFQNDTDADLNYTTAKLVGHHMVIGGRLNTYIDLGELIDGANILVAYLSGGPKFAITLNYSKGYTDRNYYEKMESFYGLGFDSNLGVEYEIMANIGAYLELSYGMIGAGKFNDDLDGFRIIVGGTYKL